MSILLPLTQVVYAIWNFWTPTVHLEAAIYHVVAGLSIVCYTISFADIEICLAFLSIQPAGLSRACFLLEVKV